MECKNAERQITPFLDGKLDTIETKKFVEHIRSCESCMEELSIHFLIKEGMQRLEEGSAFDLNSELEEELETSYYKAQLLHTVQNIFYCLNGAAAMIVLYFLIQVLWVKGF